MIKIGGEKINQLKRVTLLITTYDNAIQKVKSQLREKERKYCPQSSDLIKFVRHFDKKDLEDEERETSSSTSNRNSNNSNSCGDNNSTMYQPQHVWTKSNH
ncbi:MAG: hypothetical protein JWL77_7003, partial [Chthonomonadaceae bacterium]|nr:hypothetical protein [Chthonomonadaceae bacterium]